MILYDEVSLESQFRIICLLPILYEYNLKLIGLGVFFYKNIMFKKLIRISCTIGFYIRATSAYCDSGVGLLKFLPFKRFKVII